MGLYGEMGPETTAVKLPSSTRVKPGSSSGGKITETKMSSAEFIFFSLILGGVCVPCMCGG